MTPQRSSRSRSALLLLAGSLLLAPPALAEMGDLRGLYEVEGVTVVSSTGDERRAAGRIIVQSEGPSQYTTTFNLKTAVVTSEGTRNVTLTGFGEGRAAEDKLEGTAHTQWLMAAIPGLDPQFPWIPGRLGPRIESSFVMQPEREENTYRIEIHSRSDDAGYPPTRTMLKARRVTAEVADKLPLPTPHDD